MKKVKSQTFNGVRYNIDLEPYDGWCDDPKAKGVSGEYPTIRLPEGLPDTKKALINLIHECRHAQDYRKKEKTILRESEELGTILWRLGYRRKK